MSCKKTQAVNTVDKSCGSMVSHLSSLLLEAFVAYLFVEEAVCVQILALLPGVLALR